MNYITQKNNDGSIDVFDKHGFTEYTVGKYEIGVIADLANKLNEYETFFQEQLKGVLMDYFDINGDTYSYNLQLGLDDFEEFDEETVDDIVEHIRSSI